MEIKKVRCPFCGMELIKLEPYEDNKAEFWCGYCEIEVTIKKGDDNCD